jgi:hypothetical protein
MRSLKGLIVKINKYLPFAILYFFLNSLGLPLGLTYTLLLSPFFYYWTVVTRKRDIALPFLLVFLPFMVLQVIQGVDAKSYLISSLSMAANYIFCQTFYTFLITARDIEKIFRKLLLINFILCLIAIPLYFTPFYDILWIQQYLTAGVDNFRRLKLFTSEASLYSTIFLPLFGFYFCKIILGQNRTNSWLLMVMLFLPLALSFSLGVISAIAIAGAGCLFLLAGSLFRKRRVLSLAFLGVGLVFFALLFLTAFFPDNPLFSRIGNIFSGNDLSGKGRTSDAFFLADQILNLRSHLWGIGPGQVKIIGAKIIIDYYQYPPGYPIAIPNAAAETWVFFGWAGIFLRFGAEIFLFFRTRVWTNYYRLFLFLFIFIYQFTGSFITNIAEYVIWILAFTDVFPAFDVKPASNPAYQKRSTS